MQYNQYQDLCNNRPSVFALSVRDCMPSLYFFFNFFTNHETGLGTGKWFKASCPVVYSIVRSNLIFLNKCRRNVYTIQQTDEGKQERADLVGCSDIWTDKGWYQK